MPDKETFENLIKLSGSEPYVKAKDIKVYVENGQPYIHWIGYFNDDTNEYVIEIPKMDVNLTAIIKDFDTCYAEGSTGRIIPITLNHKIFACQDCTGYSIKRVKRSMTKEQIEKELGYKIDIVDEDDD